MLNTFKKKESSSLNGSAPKPNLDAIVRKNVDLSEALKGMKASAVVGVLSSVLAIVVMMIAIGYEPAPRYVAVDSDGRIIKIAPVYEPLLSDTTVSSWMTGVITETFSTDFLNYRRLLKTSKPFFTEKGWADFSVLYEEEFVNLIKKLSAVSRAVPQGAPVVESKGLQGGVFTWKLSQPFIVEYFSGAKSRSYEYLFTVYVQRVPTTQDPTGIAISRVIASLGGREDKKNF